MTCLNWPMLKKAADLVLDVPERATNTQMPTIIAHGGIILSQQFEPPLPVEEFNPDSICISLAGIGKDIVPDNFFLTNNYPNPFNPTTSFTFGISSSIEVKISIYNILGQKIFSYSNGKLDAGTYEFNWNGLNQIGDRVTSGIYFYEMEAGNQFRDIKKMTLLK